HVTLEMMNTEAQAYLTNQTSQLTVPIAFREFVAQVKASHVHGGHEEFFRRMLQGVEEPTAAFGLLEVRGDGTQIEEASRRIELGLSRRLRRCARALGVSAASVFHVAWGQMISQASGQDDPVFGTVVFGRMHGSRGVERVMGPLINTLPVRVRLSGVTVEQCVRQTHELLAQLLLHEHASLAEVQRYGQVPAGTPLFTALLNYRHLDESLSIGGKEGEFLASEERTNYPLTLSVDDLGEEFELVAQVDPAVGAQRLCAMMLQA